MFKILKNKYRKRRVWSTCSREVKTSKLALAVTIENCLPSLRIAFLFSSIKKLEFFKVNLFKFFKAEILFLGWVNFFNVNLSIFFSPPWKHFFYLYQ